MAHQVLVTKGVGNTLASSILKDKATRVLITKDVERRHNKKLQRVASKHYSNALIQFGYVLNRYPGTTSSITIGGNKRVRFTDGEGKGRTVNTGYWPALSRTYLRRRPKNITFWHKTGELHSAFKNVISQGGAKVTVETQNKKLVRGNKVKLFSTMTFHVPASNRVIANMLVRQLVGDNVGPFGPSAKLSVEKENLGLIETLEFGFRVGSKRPNFKSRRIRRPFVYKMSSALGSVMRTSLRKIDPSK